MTDEEAEYRQAQRVGTTPEARARWLLSLVDRPSYEKFSAQDWWALRFEMSVFTGSDPREALEVSEEDARRWYSRIRIEVKKLSRGRAWRCRLVTRYYFRLRQGEQSVQIQDLREDEMTHAIFDTLMAVKDKLRYCQLTKCGRIFVRYKRQLYCTRRCAWSARTRKHRGKVKRTGSSESTVPSAKLESPRP